MELDLNLRVRIWALQAALAEAKVPNSPLPPSQAQPCPSQPLPLHPAHAARPPLPTSSAHGGCARWNISVFSCGPLEAQAC